MLSARLQFKKVIWILLDVQKVVLFKFPYFIFSRALIVWGFFLCGDTTLPLQLYNANSFCCKEF